MPSPRSNLTVNPPTHARVDADDSAGRHLRDAAFVVGALSLILDARQEAILQGFYTWAADGTLDIRSLLRRRQITITERFCNQGGAKPDEPGNCERVPCPIPDIEAEGAVCLGQRGKSGDGGDIRVTAPYPIRRVGQYDDPSNDSFMRFLEANLGEFATLGFLRGLPVPRSTQMGVFSYVPLRQARNGDAAIAEIRRLAAVDHPPLVPSRIASALISSSLRAGPLAGSAR